jgi:hypothetical protein
MANFNTTETLEALASEIGDNVYIDVAKWHLYLKDAHLHTTLAERLYPLLEAGRISENDVSSILQQITVKLGGGKMDVPLANLIPMQGQVTLMDLLDEFQQKL